MAFHISEFKDWRAGAGTPPKYSVSFELDCAMESQTQTEATFRLTGTIQVTNYPDNSRNSWPASDFAVLTLGGYDPTDYQFSNGTSYYREPLPALPNAPQSYLDAMQIEFRGDTSRADGPNRVSLWINGQNTVINSQSTAGTWTVRLNHIFTLQLTGDPYQEVLIYTHSGANNATDYSWLAHDVWATLFNFDYRPMAVWNGYNWASCNRSNGWMAVWNGSSWPECRTESGGDASDNPPLYWNGSAWKNQHKCGQGG